MYFVDLTFYWRSLYGRLPQHEPSPVMKSSCHSINDKDSSHTLPPLGISFPNQGELVRGIHSPSPAHGSWSVSCGTDPERIFDFLHSCLLCLLIAPMQLTTEEYSNAKNASQLSASLRPLAFVPCPWAERSLHTALLSSRALSPQGPGIRALLNIKADVTPGSASAADPSCPSARDRFPASLSGR